MINNNYAKQQAQKLGENVDRVVNNKLIIYIAKKNPKYLESSQDRPNFYNEYDYNLALESEPNLTKQEYIDSRIEIYERTLELTEMSNSALIQAFMVNNNTLVFSLKPKVLADSLGINVEDIYNLVYIKTYMKDTNETKYFWIGALVNNEDRIKSITLIGTMDYWLTYYSQIILNMKGDVKILRKHFDRYKPVEDITKPLEFNYSYDSNVHNIDPSYSSLPKNIVAINGITRPNVKGVDKQIFNMEEIELSQPNIVPRSIVASSYNSSGSYVSGSIQAGNIDLATSFSRIDIQDYYMGRDKGALYKDWNSKTFSPKSLSSSGLLNDKFVYTFQYNATKTTSQENIDATYGIDFFDIAQTNNQYDESTITIDGKDVIVYNKTILNRLGNIINTKVENVLDAPSQNDPSITINGISYYIDIHKRDPDIELVMEFDKTCGLGNCQYYMKWNPYLTGDKVYYIKDGEKIVANNCSVWNLGGYYYSEYGNPDKPFNDNTTDQSLYYIDFGNRLTNISMELKKITGKIYSMSWKLTNKVITKSNSLPIKSFNANEFNKDNYNELSKSFHIQLENYEWLKETPLYEKDSDWKFNREPQVYMSHCFSRLFNYLGAGKEIPYEIFQDNYKYYLQQIITPSTAIDNIFVGSSNIKGRLMLSNGGIKIEYNNSVPSISDSFKAFMQQNQAQINNSYLTAQGNLNFAKQQQILGIVGGVVGVAGGIGGMAYSGSRKSPVYSEAKIDRTVAKQQMDFKDVPGYRPYEAVEFGKAMSKMMKSTPNTFGVLTSAGAVLSSSLGIANAVVGGNKAIFNAGQQIKQIEAVVKDVYNSPDEMIYSSSSIQDIQNYYNNINKLYENNVTNNGLIRALEIHRLPTINNIEQYSSDVNRYGYISNKVYFNQNIDTLINRDRFNYIQLGDIENAFTDIQLNNEIKNYFMNIFNEGVRLWNTKYSMLDYSKENWEISLVKKGEK